jgi:hypothetical protein
LSLASILVAIFAGDPRQKESRQFSIYVPLSDFLGVGQLPL